MAENNVGEKDRSTRDDALLLASFADIASKAINVQPNSYDMHTGPDLCTGQAGSSPSLATFTFFPALPTSTADLSQCDANRAPGSTKESGRPKLELASRSSLESSPNRSRPRIVSYSNTEIAQDNMTATATATSSLNTANTTGAMITSTYYPPANTTSSSSSHCSALHIQPQTSKSPQRPKRYRTILRKKFSWKHYPALELFLVANRSEYLRHSMLNYTSQQKKYNNMLTEQMIQLATQHHLIFDQAEFSFVTIRDRIRCYYKSYVQSLKKKGIVCGYAAKKAGLLSKEDIVRCANAKSKIYVPASSST